MSSLIVLTAATLIAIALTFQIVRVNRTKMRRRARRDRWAAEARKNMGLGRET